jgi:hypothetical protein
LEVVDAASSAPLFVIEGVKPGSGLGFANGFVVFEVPDGKLFPIPPPSPCDP